MMPNIEYNECLKDSPKFRWVYLHETHVNNKINRTRSTDASQILNIDTFVFVQKIFGTRGGFDWTSGTEVRANIKILHGNDWQW